MSASKGITGRPGAGVPATPGRRSRSGSHSSQPRSSSAAPSARSSSRRPSRPAARAASPRARSTRPASRSSRASRSSCSPRRCAPATRPSARSWATSCTRLDGTPNVVKLRSPYAQNTISKDGHSALVSFEIPGTFDTAGRQGRARSRPRRSRAQAAHPGFLIAEAGDGSFSKAYNDTQGKDFAEGRAALAADHAPDPRRRVRRPPDRRHPGRAGHERGLRRPRA